MQLSSGNGPAECERVVVHLLTKIIEAAGREQISVEVIEVVPGKSEHSALSVLIRLKGSSVDTFCSEWQGTVQWIAQSPFRKHHKRKNWFAGISVYDVSAAPQWAAKDVTYQTMRASGPGGQHVNKTQSAVRATHVPSGISATASDERSQMTNKKVATERLRNKMLSRYVEASNKQVRARWQEHHELQRGNAMKVFREPLEI